MAIIFLGALGLVEAILAFGWSRVVYRRGLLVLSIDALSATPVVPTSFAKNLEDALKPSVTLKQLSPSVYAFRRAFDPFGPLFFVSVMHGTLHVDPSSTSVRAEGRASWYILALWILCVAAAILHRGIAILLVIGVATAVFYAIQRRHFRSVLESARSVIEVENAAQPTAEPDPIGCWL